MTARAEVKNSNWREGWTPLWLAAFAAVTVAIVVLLVLLLWREWREPDRAAPQALAERLTRNGTLERQIAALEAAPLAACSTVRSADEGASPSAGAAAGGTAATPGHEAAKPADGTLANRDLVALLHDATALVLTEEGTASGFFIAPDLLVTNRHAVEGTGGMVYVTSKSLGRVHRGQVLATSPSGRTGSADFAVVRVEGGPSRRTLSFSAEIEQLMPVIAAGYPGLTIIHDAGFRALLGGDITAAPELVLNRGEVQAVQPSPLGLKVIAHSGRILHGNSGGPLVDGCGRVVGINTYAAIDPRQVGQVSYAIAAEELTRFLAASGVAANLAPASCGG
jgi:serine protease Do